MKYFDNASTTQMCQEAICVYNETNTNLFFNPSSMHKGGAYASNKLENGKKNILKLLNADGKLIFTSGATESNNLAILGCFKKGFKILSSNAEHPSVTNVLKNLNAEVDYAPINESGFVDIDKYTEMIKNHNYDFISIMHVNNETGAINDIKKLVQIAKNKNSKTIFHSDGTQSVGKIHVDLNNLGVDMFSFSAHKFYGPKGCGGLFYKKNINLKSQINGGGQQDNLRSGTENLPAILAMQKALELSIINLETAYNYVSSLKDYALLNLSKKLNYKINGNGSPYILSISIPKIKGEVLLRNLEEKEFLIGTGSACSSKKEGNITLSNMGLNKGLIAGNIRISFSNNNTIDDVKELINLINDIALQLQK